MTQTRLEQTRQAYLDECERDRKIKAKEAEIATLNAKLKNMYVNILTTSSQLANNAGNYHGVDTSEEYSTEYFRLHECRNTVEQVEKAIKFEGLFTWEEQQKNLETVSQVRNRLNLLEQKLHQHGKREGIELIL